MLVGLQVRQGWWKDCSLPHRVLLSEFAIMGQQQQRDIQWRHEEAPAQAQAQGIVLQRTLLLVTRASRNAWRFQRHHPSSSCW